MTALQHPIKIAINVITAIILGLIIDRFYIQIRNKLNKLERIALQLLTLIIAVFFVNYLYTILGITNLTESIFFISIFLGVQKTLFDDIITI